MVYQPAAPARTLPLLSLRAGNSLKVQWMLSSRSASGRGGGGDGGAGVASTLAETNDGGGPEQQGTVQGKTPLAQQHPQARQVGQDHEDDVGGQQTGQRPAELRG